MRNAWPKPGGPQNQMLADCHGGTDLFDVQPAIPRTDQHMQADVGGGIGGKLVDGFLIEIRSRVEQVDFLHAARLRMSATAVLRTGRVNQSQPTIHLVPCAHHQ